MQIYTLIPFNNFWDTMVKQFWYVRRKGHNNKAWSRLYEFLLSLRSIHYYIIEKFICNHNGIKIILAIHFSNLLCRDNVILISMHVLSRSSMYNFFFNHKFLSYLFLSDHVSILASSFRKNWTCYYPFYNLR